MTEHEYKQHRCIESNALLIGLIEQIGFTFDLFQEITNGADYLVYLWRAHPDCPKLTVDRTHFWTYSDIQKPTMSGRHIFGEHEFNEWLLGNPVGAALRIHKLRLLADLEPWKKAAPTLLQTSTSPTRSSSLLSSLGLCWTSCTAPPTPGMPTSSTKYPATRSTATSA